jgi:TP901 family phage tail tape measure protein
MANSVYEIILKLTGSPETRQELETVERSINIIKMTAGDAGRAMLDFGNQVDSAMGTLVQKNAEMERGLTNLSNIMGVSRDVAIGYNQSLTGILDSTGNQISRNDALAASYDAASSGFTETNDILGLLNNSMTLAIAGNSGLGAATDGLQDSQKAIVATFKNYQGELKAYGGVAEQTAVVSDRLFKVVKYGVTDIKQLAPEIAEMAPTAKAAGVSMDELAAVYSAMTSDVIKTTQVTTSFKALLTSVSQGGSTEQAKQMIKELGLEFDSTTIATKGLEGVFQSLADKGVTSFEQFYRLTGSSEAALGLASMSAEKFSTQLGNMKGEMEDLQGASDRLSEDGLGKLTGAANKFESELALAGAGAATFKAELLGAATSVLQEFNKLDDSTKTLILKIGSLAGTGAIVGGSFLMIASQVASSILGFQLYRAQLAQMVVAQKAASGSSLALSLSIGGVKGALMGASVAMRGYLAALVPLAAPLATVAAGVGALALGFKHLQNVQKEAKNEALSENLRETEVLVGSVEKLVGKLRESGKAIPEAEYQNWIKLLKEADGGTGSLEAHIGVLERTQEKAKQQTIQGTLETEKAIKIQKAQAEAVKVSAKDQADALEALKKKHQEMFQALSEASEKSQAVYSRLSKDLQNAVEDGTISQVEAYKVSLAAVGTLEAGYKLAFGNILKDETLTQSQRKKLEDDLTGKMKEALDTRKQIARDWIETQKSNLRTLQQIELEGIEKRAYEEKWRNEDLQSTLSKARQSHSRALIATLESERKAVAKGSSEELAIMKSLSEEKLKLARETGSLNMRTRAQDAEDAKKAREKALKEQEQAQKEELALSKKTAKEKEKILNDLERTGKISQKDREKALKERERLEKESLKAQEAAEKEATEKRKAIWEAETQAFKGQLAARLESARLEAQAITEALDFSQAVSGIQSGSLDAYLGMLGTVKTSKDGILGIDKQIKEIQDKGSEKTKEDVQKLKELKKEKSESLKGSQLVTKELELQKAFLAEMGIQLGNHKDARQAELEIARVKLDLERQQNQVLLEREKIQAGIKQAEIQGQILGLQREGTKEGTTKEEKGVLEAQISNLQRLAQIVGESVKSAEKLTKLKDTQSTLETRGKLAAKGIDPGSLGLPQGSTRGPKGTPAVSKVSLNEESLKGLSQSLATVSKASSDALKSSIDPAKIQLGAIGEGLTKGFTGSIQATQNQTQALRGDIQNLTKATSALPAAIARLTPKAAPVTRKGK